MAETEALPVIALHPQIADAYRKRIDALSLTLGSTASDQEVALQIRALVESIQVTPRADRGVDIEVLGSLHAVLAAAEGRLPPKKGANFMPAVVAEEGLEPPTRGL